MDHESTPGLAHEDYAEDRAASATAAEAEAEAERESLPRLGEPLTEMEYAEGVTPENDPAEVAAAQEREATDAEPRSGE